MLHFTAVYGKHLKNNIYFLKKYILTIKENSNIFQHIFHSFVLC